MLGGTIFIEELFLNRPFARHLSYLLLALAGTTMPALAAAQDSTEITVPRSVARPHAIKWWEVGAVVGAGLLTMAVVDGPVQEWSSDPTHGSQTADDFATAFRYFGQWQVIAPVTGGLIIAGLAAKKPGLLHSGLRVGASVLLAGAVTGVFKYSLGRVRPYDTNEVWDYQPFSGNTSMWSGHTVLAFAFATSLAQEIHRTWATVGLYTLATGTAWSRVYDNQHWVSDVVIGAAVGIASAKLATGRWTIFGLRAPVPLATPNGLGLMWHGTF
jgi:membrane-associated phospholipid phosphatase